MRIEVTDPRGYLKQVRVNLPQNTEQVALEIVFETSRYDLKPYYVMQPVVLDDKHWRFNVCDDDAEYIIQVKVFPETAEDFAVYDAPTRAVVDHSCTSKVTRCYFLYLHAIPITPIVVWNVGDPEPVKTEFRSRYKPT